MPGDAERYAVRLGERPSEHGGRRGDHARLYEGKVLKGWPEVVIKGGRVAYEGGKIAIEPGAGAYLRRTL
ncbi:MAG: hypothetical protein M0Z81_17485 [Deltaproteobacteria bacterium]|nr:hypothetical protein [Deltaproteobacteria bacterium]